MSIKCGHCGDYHDGVAGVRACYAGEYGPPVPGWDGDPMAPRPTTAAASEFAVTAVVATEKQIDYINSLRAQRGVEGRVTGTFLKAQASAEITRLLDIRRRFSTPSRTPNTNMVAGVDTSGIREGRYAVEIDGNLKFYKVDKPTEGRWTGYTFVKVQASDDLWSVRGAGATAVLVAIAKDPQAAMLRYGRELGHCGHCGRTLTNELSRRLGIGPICRAKPECAWMDLDSLIAELAEGI